MANSDEELNRLINSEEKFFSKINERVRGVSEADLIRWRSETVQERRNRISLELYRLVNGVVKYGPFKGLKLVRETWWGESDLGSQCLGLYEMEILNFLKEVERDDYKSFIDIGAADGYYAIGMLVSGKVSKCICYEKSESGRRVIMENWKANGSLGELKLYPEANFKGISSLDPVVLNKALVLIDIEGAEFDLLDEMLLYILRKSTLILEIHNWVKNFEDLYVNLLERANKFFDIEVIEHLDRPINQIFELQELSDDNRNLLVSEGRPSLMRFLKLIPKEHDSSD